MNLQEYHCEALNMNLQEFAALKVGDKIKNPMSGSAGEVVETTANGVRVSWGGSSTFGGFLYSVNSTAWFHWLQSGHG